MKKTYKNIEKLEYTMKDFVENFEGACDYLKENNETLKVGDTLLWYIYNSTFGKVALEDCVEEMFFHFENENNFQNEENNREELLELFDWDKVFDYLVSDYRIIEIVKEKK